MALNPLLSLIGRLVARSGRKRGNRQTDRQTDRQNDKTTTITLAAHARRGLTTSYGSAIPYMELECMYILYMCGSTLYIIIHVQISNV